MAENATMGVGSSNPADQNGGHHTAQMGHEPHVRLSESTGEAGSPADIKEHMEVYAACGNFVGKVDRVEGQRIKLTRSDSADGQHHVIPISWVAKVHDHVHLSKDHEEVQRDWTPA
jgi:hypothetical protein